MGLNRDRVTDGYIETSLYSFGNNMYGQLGIGKNKKTTPGQLVAESQLRLVNFDKTIKDVACGLDNTVLTTEGRHSEFYVQVADVQSRR